MDALLSTLKSRDASELLVIGLAVPGAIALIRTIGVFLSAIWVMFLRPGKNLRRYGAWAIVTGATDGIGKGFAKELARKKINVILVSRTEEKLNDVAKELQSKHKIDTRVVPIDFSKTREENAKGYAALEALVKELEVGILVNNVGQSYPFAMYLHEMEDDLVASLIRVNIEPLTFLSKIVLPGMVLRKRGAIVNIGSGAATVIPSDPLYTVYAGTKAYVDQFSKSLSVEYSKFGIDVQCQAPLYVATKLAKIRHASLTCPSPDGYAKAGAAWVGQEPRCTPYWAHNVMWGIIRRMPERLLDSVRLSQNVDIRRRGMAKLAKSK